MKKKAKDILWDMILSKVKKADAIYFNNKKKKK